MKRINRATVLSFFRCSTCFYSCLWYRWRIGLASLLAVFCRAVSHSLEIFYARYSRSRCCRIWFVVARVPSGSSSKGDWFSCWLLVGFRFAEGCSVWHVIFKSL